MVENEGLAITFLVILAIIIYLGSDNNDKLTLA